MIKLALCGMSGSGKTYISSLLRDQFQFVVAHSGEICRQLSWSLFGNENRGNLNNVSQTIREFDKHFFLKAALKTVSNEYCNMGRIVFDSLRYDEDFVYLRGMGFKIIRIESPQNLSQSRLIQRGQVFSKKDMQHSSESEFLVHEADYILYNSTEGGVDTSRFLREMLMRIENET